MLTRTWTAHVGDAPGMRVRVTTPAARDAGQDSSAGGVAEAASSGSDVTWETAADQALVEASLAGRSGAFDVIVERYRRQVYQLCYRFVGNHEDASDLAQDVFIRAYRGLRGYKARASLGTWLYRIAVNVSLNRLALKTPRTEALEVREHRDTGTELPDTILPRAERAT